MEPEELWNEIKELVKNKHEKRLQRLRDRIKQTRCRNKSWKLSRWEEKSKPRKTKSPGKHLAKNFSKLLENIRSRFSATSLKILKIETDVEKLRGHFQYQTGMLNDANGQVATDSKNFLMEVYWNCVQ